MKCSSLSPTEIVFSPQFQTSAPFSSLLNDSGNSTASDEPLLHKISTFLGAALDVAPGDPRSTPPTDESAEHVWKAPHLKVRDSPSITRQYALQADNIDNMRTQARNEISEVVGTVAVLDFLSPTFSGQRHNGLLSRAYENAHANAKRNVSALLDKVPTGAGVEKDMYKAIMEAITTIHKALRSGQSTIVLEDTSSDLTLYPDNNMKDKWEYGLGFVEVKPADKQNPLHADEQDCSKPLRVYLSQMQVWNQIQDYATRAYRGRSRCFSVAIGIFGKYARFFRWDQSLAMVARAFDYKKEPEFLWKFVVAFGSPDHCGNGLDPTVGDHLEVERLAVAGLEEKYAKARAKRLLSLEVSALADDDLRKQSSVITIPSPRNSEQAKYMSIGPPLFVSRAVWGEGCDHFVIIKESGRDETRAPEGLIYKAIHGDTDHVFGVARIRSDVDLYDSAFSSDGRNAVHRTIGKWAFRYFGRKFCSRTHHRCVLDSVGIDLTSELMEAIRDGVMGHRNMTSRSALHRDISASNVVISAYSEMEDAAKGFLIDMDYAAVTGQGACDDELRDITGTTAFLSMARAKSILKKQIAPHATWNDLESLFWVTLYIVVRHTDTGGTMPVERIVEIFDRGLIGQRKQYVQEGIADIEVRAHAPLVRCLQNLAQLVASHYLWDHLKPAQKAWGALPPEGAPNVSGRY
ncbi:hypothetical protein OE88DRAFT_1643541 [Heliocybe sulcata]|uniref:Fungal-type protein kinase domain-containing protein n=1 Tax=Heliocybe sulcata TaxID=5364 RepID=A0A5C3N513_9AGAM|nr:hypothetical protein OE88DRAFT_1643541 [Heliocybe sulcata]